MKYRVVQKKGTVLLSTSLAWPAVAGCSRAEIFSQLSSISFAQPCIYLISRKESRQTEHPPLDPTGLMLVEVDEVGTGEFVRSISTTFLGVWVAFTILSSPTETSGLIKSSETSGTSESSSSSEEISMILSLAKTSAKNKPIYYHFFGKGTATVINVLGMNDISPTTRGSPTHERFNDRVS